MKKFAIIFALASVMGLYSCGSGDTQKASQTAKEEAERLLNEMEEAMDDLGDDVDDFTADVEENFQSFKAEAEQALQQTQSDVKDAALKVQDTDGSYTDDEGRTVYTMVSEMPSFRKGEKDLFKYLRRNIKYPSASRDAGEEGKALVQFVVAKDGTIDHVEVVRSTGHEALDAEAKRVIENMPEWNPGVQGGEPVNVRYTLPVTFTMNN